jgi:methyl-accepting chemotaxis protein
MRGDKVADAYPSLAEALKMGHTTSDVWLNRERQEQLLASYAPVRGDDGAILGALVIGTPLNDERLSRTSGLTSGAALSLGVKQVGKIEIIAKSEQVGSDVLAIVQSPTVLEAAAAALASGNLAHVGGASKDYLVATAPLSGYGGGNNAALVAVAPASLVASVTNLLWPVFAVAGLGILLVIAGGVVLGNYISQPISEVEEGLLQIINGKTDLRFQLEHEELGGLIFRINSLLNALMGVPETDEEGRTSAAPERPYQE